MSTAPQPPRTGDRTIDHRFAPASSWTSIGRPDDAHKTVVREDGALLLGFDSDTTVDWSFARVVEFRPTTTHAPVEIRQWTEDARSAIVVTELRCPHLTLILRAVGHLDDAGGRIDLVTWDLTVHEDAPAGLLVGLHLDVHDRAAHFLPPRWAPSNVAVAFTADALPASDLFLDDELVADPADLQDLEPGRCLVSLPQPLTSWHPTAFRPASGLRTVPQVAAPGEVLSGVILLPLTGTLPSSVDLAWVARAVDTERRFWQELDVLDLPVRIPDPDLQGMLVASARNLLQARDLDEHGRPLFQIGPTMYRGLFMVDGYFLLETARYLGLDGDADHGLDILLEYVRADGSVNIMAGQLDAEAYPHHKETGIAVATLVRQWELTGDTALLRSRWTTVRNAIGHIERLRAEAHALPADHPAHGLMPPAYTDGGLSGVRAELSTAVWTLIGLQAAERAVAEVAPEDEAWVSGLATSLRQDLERVLQRQVATDHAAIMALDPDDAHHLYPGRRTASPVRAINPGTGTWAFAQGVFPGELLSTDHPAVTRFLALLEDIDDVQGIPAETGWLPYRSLWTYYASFAAHAWLHSGRPDKAVDYLYAFANHAAPTRVWREEQALTHTGDDQVFGDMPHNWASAEFLRLVRNLLVLERQAGVELLAGLPDAWLVPDDPVRVSTPTAFGRLDVEVATDPHGDGGRIEITASDGGVRQGALSLRVPAGSWRVRVADHDRAVSGPDLVTLGIVDRGRFVAAAD